MQRLTSTVLFSILALASCGQDQQPASSSGIVAQTPAPQATLEALREAGDLEGIVARLEPLWKAGSLSVEDAFLLADARVAQNELPKAILVLKGTLAASPDALQHSLLLAQVYTSIGRPQQALDVLDAARAADGPSAALALALGLAHGRLGEMERAQELLREAGELGADPDDVDYNLSLIQMQLGQNEQAKAGLARLLKRDPTRQSVRRELARATLSTDPEAKQTVRDLCNTVLEASPEDWRAWEILGDVELSNQDYLAAQTYYTSALEFGSKEIGNNPPRVAEKYKVAALKVRSEFIEEGVIPKDADHRGSPPPLPTGFMEERREERRKALEAQQAASGGGPEILPPAQDQGGR